MYIIVCKFVYPVVTQDNKEDEEERERERVKVNKEGKKEKKENLPPFLQLNQEIAKNKGNFYSILINCWVWPDAGGRRRYWVVVRPFLRMAIPSLPAVPKSQFLANRVR